MAEQERRSLVAASRCVDAIVALGGGESDDSDRDDESEELLWLRVKAKIAERRRKFRQLDQTARGGAAGEEEARSAPDGATVAAAGAACQAGRRVAAVGIRGRLFSGDLGLGWR